jgi:hypothetical protein
MAYLGSVAFFALLYIVSAAGIASADDGPSGKIALSIAPLVGQHVESNLVTSTDGVPIPILQIDGRYHGFELFAESLPGSPTITASSQDYRSLSTRLAFFDAVVRGYDPSRRFWIGAGEIVYNQSTYYLPFEDLSQSRVVGGRYELGSGLSRNPERIRFWVDFMPGMQGNVFQKYGSSNDSFSRSYAEHATQFESQLAVNNTHGRVTLSYGVRYLNYVAKITRFDELADKNTGFLPYATFAYNFGK